MPDVIRILLVDDHEVVRAGLEVLLEREPDMEVVGGAGTGEDAMDQVRLHRPDVVLMDLSMPGMGGVEATRRIVALGQGTRVLVLTSHAEEDCLLEVLESGGNGYVRKTAAEQDLITAIRLAARDEVFLYPKATKLLLQSWIAEKQRGRDPDPLEELSAREREVLALTAEGYSSALIGKKLFLSPKTVDTYRSRLMRKLGLQNRTDVVHFALENRLLQGR